MTGVTGLDHLIIAVGDLDRAEATMASLGFRPTPRGYHSAEMGTANATIMLPDQTYFEVLAPIAETPANEEIRQGIAAGKALFGFATKIDEADVAHAAFTAAGVVAGGVRDFTRAVDLPDGPRDAVFRAVYLDGVATPGAYGFCIEHQTPEVVWRPDYLAHPNGVTTIRRVIGVASDPAATAATWGRVPGMSAAGGTVILGARSLEFVEPASFEAAYGIVPSSDPGLGALVFGAADLAVTRKALQDGGVDVLERDEGLQAIAEGVAFQFEQI